MIDRTKALLKRRVSPEILKVHQFHVTRIERFIEDDPIALARGRVNMALLKRIAPSWVLFISHGLGGGTDTAIADLCKLHEAEGRRVLLLRSTVAGRMELIPPVQPHDQRLVAEDPALEANVDLEGVQKNFGALAEALFQILTTKAEVSSAAAADPAFWQWVTSMVTRAPAMSAWQSNLRPPSTGWAPVQPPDHVVASARPGRDPALIHH